MAKKTNSLMSLINLGLVIIIGYLAYRIYKYFSDNDSEFNKILCWFGLGEKIDDKENLSYDLDDSIENKVDENSNGFVAPQLKTSMKELKKKLRQTEMNNMSPLQAYRLGEIYHYGKFNKPVSSKKAIQYYQLAEQGGLRGKAYYGLANLYQEGSKGMAPDAMVAIDFYLKALKEGEYLALVGLGDIYANGVHPSYLPNKVAAKEIFELIIELKPESGVGIGLKNVAKEKIISLNKNNTNNNSDFESGAPIDTDTDGMANFLPSDIVFTIRNNFPNHPLGSAGQKYFGGGGGGIGGGGGGGTGSSGSGFGMNNGIGLNGDNQLPPISNVGTAHLDNNSTINTNIFENTFTPMGGGGVGGGGGGGEGGGDDPVLRNIQRTLWNDIQLIYNGATRDEVVDDTLWTQDVRIRNYSENVHDHNLNDFAKASIENLREAYPSKEIDDKDKNRIKEEIISLIENSGADGQKRRNAFKVIGSLSDFKHSRFGLSEKDAMALVWNRINHKVNKDRINELTNNLINNLDSGVERGLVVCSTGKIMRLLGCLDNCDAEDYVMLKPSWAINDEIAGTTSRIRDEILGSVNDKVKQDYLEDKGGEDVEELVADMRDRIKEKCYEDYVDTGILTKAEVDLKIEPYIGSL